MDQLSGANPSERSLAHYLSLFKRNWPMIAVPTVVAMAMAFTLASRSEDVYVSKATVRVSEPGSALAGGRSSTEIDQELSTSVEILGSRPVRERVLEEVSPEAAAAFLSFEAGRIDETVLVELEVRATEPGAAQEIAQEWGNTFVEQERSQGGGGLLERASELAAQAEALQADIEALDERISALAPAPGGGTPPQLSRALSERQSLFEEQAEYRRRAIEFEIEAELREGGVALVVPASQPGAPVAPKPVQTTAGAAVLGLLLGSGLAVLRDELDTRLRGRDDLRDVLPGVPILAAIPGRRHARRWSRRAHVQLRTDNASIEAFRALATNLELMRVTESSSNGVSGRGRVVVVTSPKEGDGKTTTVANLSTALAALGRQVVLVNADLRNGDLHEVFDAQTRPGIAEIVLDEVEPSSALQMLWTDERGDLTMLAGGRRTRDPVHILSSAPFVGVIDDLAMLADYVLIDAPPVLPVTDTLTLSRVADSVILVVADGRSNRQEIASTAEALKQVGLEILGAVLTSAKAGEASYGHWAGIDEPPDNIPPLHPPHDTVTIDLDAEATELVPFDGARDGRRAGDREGDAHFR